MTETDFRLQLMTTDYYCYFVSERVNRCLQFIFNISFHFDLAHIMISLNFPSAHYHYINLRRKVTHCNAINNRPLSILLISCEENSQRYPRTQVQWHMQTHPQHNTDAIHLQRAADKRKTRNRLLRKRTLNEQRPF